MTDYKELVEKLEKTCLDKYSDHLQKRREAETKEERTTHNDVAMVYRNLVDTIRIETGREDKVIEEDRVDRDLDDKNGDVKSD